MCCVSLVTNDFLFRFNCSRPSKLDERTVYLPRTVYFCANTWWYQWTELRRLNTININNTTRIRYLCRWPRTIQHWIDSQHKHRLAPQLIWMQYLVPKKRIENRWKTFSVKSIQRWPKRKNMLHHRMRGIGRCQWIISHTLVRTKKNQRENKYEVREFSVAAKIIHNCSHH